MFDNFQCFDVLHTLYRNRRAIDHLKIFSEIYQQALGLIYLLQLSYKKYNFSVLDMKTSQGGKSGLSDPGVL
jgi:hypothetical protein